MGRGRQPQPGDGHRGRAGAAGHQLTFLGRPAMVDRVRSAGLEALPFATWATDLDRFSFHPGLRCSATQVRRQWVRNWSSGFTDSGLMSSSSTPCSAPPATSHHQFDCPRVVMLHTFLNQLFDQWRQPDYAVGHAQARRVRRTPDIDVLWESRTSSTSARWQRSTPALPPDGTTWSRRAGADC